MLEGQLEKLWRRFWWSRGIVAAFLLVSILPAITDISRFKWLTAFHLAAVAWDQTMAGIGLLIGKLPYVPDVPAVVVDGFIFFSAIGLPIFIALFRSSSQIVEHHTRNTFSPQNFSIFGLVYSILVLILMAFSLISNFFILTVLYILTKYYSLDVNEWQLVVLISCYLALFYYALKNIRGYAKGLFFVVTFCLAVEVLYLISHPNFSFWIDSFICSYAESPGDVCNDINT